MTLYFNIQVLYSHNNKLLDKSWVTIVSNKINILANNTHRLYYSVFILFLKLRISYRCWQVSSSLEKYDQYPGELWLQGRLCAKSCRGMIYILVSGFLYIAYQNNTCPLFLLILPIAIGFIDVFIVQRLKTLAFENRHKKINQKLEEINKFIDDHITTLDIKRGNSIDDYGQVKYDQWLKEKEYFITNVLKRQLDLDEVLNFISENTLISCIDKRLDEYEVKNIVSDYYDDMDPYIYEQFCAQLLNQNSWQTCVTKKSGDQGADIIAKKNNDKIVIQCKKHNKPVGNKSVQEIYAAKEFYKATRGIVVSNNVFTRSAKLLAKKLNIDLLNHKDLLDL